MTDTLNALNATSPVAELANYGVPTHTVVGAVTTGANAATFTAPSTGKQWYLCEFTLSFGATTTAAATLTVKDDTTVIYSLLIPITTEPAPIQIQFGRRPLHGTINKAITIGLTSPGTIASNISASGFLAAAP